jgi:uncharacterized protein involved in type VI secretion and phage assembly
MSEGLFGIYSGTITYRDDNEGLGRVKVQIPGIFSPGRSNEGPWCFPRGGGSKNWGKNDVPPLGSDVLIQFINGNIDRPIYEPAWHGKPLNKETNQQESEVFPEFEHPDVHVFGRGWLRLVIDDREGQRVARLKAVKEIDGKEEDVVWIEFNYEDNALQFHGVSAVGVSAEAIIDIDAPAVQVRGRKVVPNNKPIN